VSVVVIIAILFGLNYSSRAEHCSISQFSDTQVGTDRSRYGKITMLYGDRSDTTYQTFDRALQTHAHHARRHNYQHHVLDREVVEGVWSKTFYLISLLVAQLSKADHLEWLVWSDADTVLINSEIPLDIFTPATDDLLFQDVMLVMARDQWGMNSGHFFIRVHPKSVHILTRAFAYPFSHEKEFASRRGHRIRDQLALELLIQDPSYQKHVLWAPSSWFNPRFFEIRPGAMCGHFYSDENRTAHMQEWMAKQDQDANRLQIPYEETFYPEEVEHWWRLNKDCRRTLTDTRKVVNEKKGNESLSKSLSTMEEACLWHSDNTTQLDGILRQVKQEIELLHLTS